MKRNFTIFSLSFISLVFLSVLVVNSFAKQDASGFTSDTITGLHERAERKEARVEGYRTWLNSMKANPKTGKVEMEDVFAAREQMREYYQKVEESGRWFITELRMANNGPIKCWWIYPHYFN